MLEMIQMINVPTALTLVIIKITEILYKSEQLQDEVQIQGLVLLISSFLPFISPLSTADLN